MTAKQEIEDLGAQNIALTHLIIALGQHLSKVSPDLASAIRAAFDDASNNAETIGFKLKAAPVGYFTKAVRIIEEMRTATLGNQTKPKDIV